MAHLLELRDRLLRMVAAVFVVFLVLFPFANDIYIFVAEPLMARMPDGTNMIATGVAAPFLTPFKLSLMAAVFLSMPFILYQFWAFVAPGLYRHEKKLVMPLLISSSLLFYLGMLFAYYIVFPLVFAFFIGTTPDGVAVMTDISQYLDFILTLFFAFGIAFEVPIATILVVWMGMTTPQDLGKKRPYIIVGAFVIGMLLTPPDVISQTLLALPMWVLFELGVQCSKFFVREREEEGVESAAETTPSAPSGAAAEPEPVMVGADIAAGDMNEPGRYAPMTDDEMEAELDRIEAEEAEQGMDDADRYGQDDEEGHDEDRDEDRSKGDDKETVEQKLHRIRELRNSGDETALRNLLYEILAQGDENQRLVARNILEQLDS